MIPVVDSRHKDQRKTLAEMDPGEPFMYDGDIFYRPIFANNVILKSDEMQQNMTMLPVIYIELGSIVLLSYDTKVYPVDLEIHIV